MKLLQRIKRIEEKISETQPVTAAFDLESGARFDTRYDPLTYLLKYGTQTRYGKIKGYVPPPCERDPISKAVLEEITQQIERKDAAR